MGGRNGSESVFALDAETGRELWATPLGPIYTFKGNIWGDGPRSTPTVDGPYIYALGAQGELGCLDAQSGKKIWQISVLRDLQGEMSPAGGGPKRTAWGFCESPLVDGDHLICTPGGPQGALAALDKKNGKVIWRSTELPDPATYSSIVAAEIGGIRQYVQLTDRGVIGVAARDGKLLWRYLRKQPYPEFVIPTPIVQGDLVYTAVGYGAGCDLVKIVSEGGKFKATKIYANKNMVNQHGGVVLAGDDVFGYSEGKGWVCQRFPKGNIAWAEKRKLGRGSLTCADGKLYCCAEDDGTTALIEAGDQGWKEHGSLRLPRQSSLRKSDGKVWTHPVVTNGKLFLRDQDLIFCFDVREPTKVGAGKIVDFPLQGEIGMHLAKRGTPGPRP
jgi:outer membrane protein assembly factor BamB